MQDFNRRVVYFRSLNSLVSCWYQAFDTVGSCTFLLNERCFQINSDQSYKSKNLSERLVQA